VSAPRDLALGVDPVLAADLEAACGGPAPEPSPELAALLEGGSPRRVPQRSRRTARVSVAAKLAVGIAVLGTGAAAAGVADVLPGPIDRAVREVAERVWPFAPDGDYSSDEPVRGGDGDASGRDGAAPVSSTVLDEPRGAHAAPGDHRRSSVAPADRAATSGAAEIAEDGAASTSATWVEEATGHGGAAGDAPPAPSSWTTAVGAPVRSADQVGGPPAPQKGGASAPPTPPSSPSAPAPAGPATANPPQRSPATAPKGDAPPSPANAAASPAKAPKGHAPASPRNPAGGARVAHVGPAAAEGGASPSGGARSGREQAAPAPRPGPRARSGAPAGTGLGVAASPGAQAPEGQGPTRPPSGPPSAAAQP
jgi:hypothetical protein